MTNATTSRPFAGYKHGFIPAFRRLVRPENRIRDQVRGLIEAMICSARRDAGAAPLWPARQKCRG